MINKEIFLKKYLKTPVVEYQNNTCKKPVVSVSIVAYQHYDYIGKCLDGALMQKTNFDFEILVGEDDSSDGTRDICIKYAKKYPNKIRLFLHSKENKIHVYGKPTGHFNYRYNNYSARGKYIAFCDGDDYWVDPLKLQKQVDFLEKNPDYGMIFSDINMIDKNNKSMMTPFLMKLKKLYKSGNVFWDLMENNYINTLTTCTRKDLLLDYFNRFHDEEFAYDYRTWLHVATYSKIKFVNEKWAAYRVHELGVSRSNDYFIKRTPLVQQAALVNYFSVINHDTSLINKSAFSRVVFNILKNKELSKNEKNPLINILKNHPRYLLYIFKHLYRKGVNSLKIK